MWARHRTKTHKPPCQAYYRIIVSFTITMVFTNYADGRSSRKDARRRKGSSSRVGSHRGTWYTAINTSTDRLKLTMTKGGRETIPTGDSHADSITWLQCRISREDSRQFERHFLMGDVSRPVSALGQSCLSTIVYLCVYSAEYTRTAYLWQVEFWGVYIEIIKKEIRWFKIVRILIRGILKNRLLFLPISVIWIYHESWVIYYSIEYRFLCTKKI